MVYNQSGFSILVKLFSANQIPQYAQLTFNQSDLTTIVVTSHMTSLMIEYSK